MPSDPQNQTTPLFPPSERMLRLCKTLRCSILHSLGEDLLVGFFQSAIQGWVYYASQPPHFSLFIPRLLLVNQRGPFVAVVHLQV